MNGAVNRPGLRFAALMMLALAAIAAAVWRSAASSGVEGVQATGAEASVDSTGGPPVVIVDAQPPPLEMLYDGAWGAPADGDHLLPPKPVAPESAPFGGEAEPAGPPDTASASPAWAPEQPDSPGAVYTWHDGDRILRAQLDTGLVVPPDVEVITADDIIPADDLAAVAQSDTGGAPVPAGQPVFRSEAGELMALPGGALVVLDPQLSAAAVEEFFERNQIDPQRLSEMDWIDNGFFVETEPGFASLELANALAVQPGVELSSPNWWVERVPQ